MNNSNELNDLIIEYSDNIKLKETKDLIDLMNYLKSILDEDNNIDYFKSIINKKNNKIKYLKEEVENKKNELKRFCDKNYDIYLRDCSKEPGYVKVLNLKTASDQEIMNTNIITGFF